MNILYYIILRKELKIHLYMHLCVYKIKAILSFSLYEDLTEWTVWSLSPSLNLLWRVFGSCLHRCTKRSLNLWIRKGGSLSGSQNSGKNCHCWSGSRNTLFAPYKFSNIFCFPGSNFNVLQLWRFMLEWPTKEYNKLFHSIWLMIILTIWSPVLQFFDIMKVIFGVAPPTYWG